MALTKAELVSRIYQKGALKKSEAVKAVDTLLELMKSSFERGEDVLISGFGKFNVKEKRARRGRNPHTGEEILLEPRRVVTFRASGLLRARMNRS